jgi:hypothetical protein
VTFAFGGGSYRYRGRGGRVFRWAFCTADDRYLTVRGNPGVSTALKDGRGARKVEWRVCEKKIQKGKERRGEVQEGKGGGDTIKVGRGE